MQIILRLIYHDAPGVVWLTWESRERNAGIYRRYLAGEDSVMLSHVFRLSDRRILRRE
jgi:hypothetical protein